MSSNRTISVRFFKTILIVASLCLGMIEVVCGHPLGNFTISHFSRLGVGADRVRVHYVVEMAEVSTFQELEAIDADGDRSPSEAELNRYADRIARVYADSLRLSIDDARLPLALIKRKVSILSGDGGLPVLQLECDLEASLNVVAPGAAHKLRFEDGNHAERSGWRELVATPEAGMNIYNSNVYGNGITDELKAYPKDMLSAPLNEQMAELWFSAGQAPEGATPLRYRDGRPVEIRSKDRLTELIRAPILTWQTACLGLLIAAALGAFHALSPGHGKAVVGAYLIGSRGTAKHAAFLGLTVTITHTAGVFALGFVTLFGANYIVPEKLFPLLTLLSGLIVVVIGLQQLFSRWRGVSKDEHQGQAEDLSHNNSVFTADHDHELDPGRLHSYTHSHGGRSHSHAPPSQITWRSLLALGVSGGLLPCPSALVVLLSAIALHRIGYGLLLVVAFSAGLAGALTGVGLLFIYARRFVERPAMSRLGMLARATPVFSALVISCIGVAICVGALAQKGIMIAQVLTLLKIR